MIKGVIFDLDGTLLNTLEDLKEGVNAAMREVGVKECTIEEVRSNIGGGVRNLIERSLKGQMEHFDKALEVNTGYYDTHLTVFTKAYPGILELLKKLKDAGFQMGVLSNKYDSATQRLVQHFFSDFIDKSYGLVESYPRKPDTTLFFKLLEEMNLSKEEVIYVGDSEVDLALAKNAKIPCILVSWGFRKNVPGEDYYFAQSAKDIWGFVEACNEK